MAKPKRRKKASDIFRETEYRFAKKTPFFEEAFPQIEDLRVEVTESDDMLEGGGCVRVYTIKDPPGEYIDCSNPLCYNGGFSIGPILRDMVRKGETERETTKRCQGYEGSPKGRRKYKLCWIWFKIKVFVKYRNGEA
ncbi:MAG: hypothetical protein H8D43_03930 [Chloroflexi bacterium]|nr:hypothetical protein [Chloroflexota bacterium]